MQAAAGLCEEAGLRLQRSAPAPAATAAAATTLAVPSQRIEVAVPLLAALAAEPPSAQHTALVARALAGLAAAAGSVEPVPAAAADSAETSRSWYVDRKIWAAPPKLPEAASVPADSAAAAAPEGGDANAASSEDDDESE